jgi:hypothetical protein
MASPRYSDISKGPMAFTVRSQIMAVNGHSILPAANATRSLT